jgi:prepilin-type N-terminal cleavage/methylation domain-containing protein/prepilin-type processing-associated H-X9-DG protein
MVRITRRQFSQRASRAHRSGWSLVEMLVVISIIGMLASLLLPAIQSARMAASRAQCQNNMRQIGVALFAHATTSANQYLPGGGAPSLRPVPQGMALQPRTFDDVPAKGERQSWGWAYQLLPFLDQENRWLNPEDEVVRGSRVSVYLCPSRDRQTLTFAQQPAGAIHYVGNACSNCDLTSVPAGPQKPGKGKPPKSVPLDWGAGGAASDGAFIPTASADGAAKSRPRSLNLITDGLSNTILLAEKQHLASETPCNDSTGWVSGYPVRHEGAVYGHDSLFSGREGALARDERSAAVQCTSRAGGPHGVGGNVLFADGSVRFMVFDIDDALWRALLSVSGKEDVDIEAGRVLAP